MKARLLFGAGIFTLYEIATIWSLFREFSDGSGLDILTATAATLAFPLPIAAIAAAAFSLGVWVFSRQPTPLSSYFLGLGCAGLVAGGYRLLESLHFSFGVYGRIADLVFPCLAGLLGSTFSARGDGIAYPSNSLRSPVYLAGFTCCCGVFATFFPLFYCPCTGHEAWLWYVVLGGAIAWLISALTGAVLARTSEQRAVFVVAVLAAPAAYLVILILGVSH